MSDRGIPEQPELMSAVRARNLSRLYKGLADTLRQEGYLREAQIANNDAQCMTHRSDAYERLEVQRIEIEQLRPIANAAMALRDKLKAIHDDDAFKSVWLVNQCLIGPYRGPTYTDELAALDAALDAVPSAKASR